MTFYLSSPNNQLQAAACADMPVLLSYGILGKSGKPTVGHWMNKGYQQSFSRVLVDSGAFSVMNSGQRIEASAYRDWSEQWVSRADAVAGLDDIEGDWRQSLRNYEAVPWSFPTFHDTDPPELLDDLVALAYERDGWLGLGLLPPREKKQEFMAKTLDRIPPDVHIHGWALWRYSGLKGFARGESCSFDSTNWWRDALKLRTHVHTAHLTFSECLEIVVKRYRRMARSLR